MSTIKFTANFYPSLKFELCGSEDKVTKLFSSVASIQWSSSDGQWSSWRG